MTVIAHPSSRTKKARHKDYDRQFLEIPNDIFKILKIKAAHILVSKQAWDAIKSALNSTKLKWVGDFWTMPCGLQRRTSF